MQLNYTQLCKIRDLLDTIFVEAVESKAAICGIDENKAENDAALEHRMNTLLTVEQGLMEAEFKHKLYETMLDRYYTLEQVFLSKDLSNAINAVSAQLDEMEGYYFVYDEEFSRSLSEICGPALFEYIGGDCLCDAEVEVPENIVPWNQSDLCILAGEDKSEVTFYEGGISTVGIELVNGGKMPTKRREDAGYDLYINLNSVKRVDNYLVDVKGTPYKLIEKEGKEFVEINGIVLFPVGFKIELPEDYMMRIAERGSSGSAGMRVRCGVVDSGFRGEVLIAIEGSGMWPVDKAIAQGLIQRVEHCEFEERALGESLRGSGKLGSSGK